MESEHREGILQRIEEKLNDLLGRRHDDWHDRSWAPLDSPVASYGPGDPSPRLFGGPRADAPGWDPGLAGPRFDRIDVVRWERMRPIPCHLLGEHRRRCWGRTVPLANITS